MSHGASAGSNEKNRLRESRFSLGRSCLLALVFVAHVVPLGYLLFPPAPIVWRDAQPISTADALLVRFVLSDAKDHPRPVATATRRAVTSRPSTKKHQPTRASTPQASTEMQATLATPAPQTAKPQLPSGADYIPGGGAFQQRAGVQYGRQNVRIPGNSFLSHALRFSMVDPRTQGFGGFVRSFRSRLGSVDPNCLDLDAWHGMTSAERIAHEVPSEEKMQKIADKYHCIPPRQL